MLTRFDLASSLRLNLHHLIPTRKMHFEATRRNGSGQNLARMQLLPYKAIPGCVGTSEVHCELAGLSGCYEFDHSIWMSTNRKTLKPALNNIVCPKALESPSWLRARRL